MKKLLIFLLFFFPAICFADITPSPIPLNVQTLNGAVSAYPYQILVPNGSLVATGGIIELQYVGGVAGITAVGDCPNGNCFNGTQGTLMTYFNSGGNATIQYDGTQFNISKPIVVTGGITSTLTAGQQGNLKLYEDPTNGVNYIKLQAPSSLAADKTYTLPTVDGSNGNQLTTNGAGTLSWAAAGGGGGGTPGGSDTQVQYNSSGSFAGNSNFTFNATTSVVSLTTLTASGTATGSVVSATSALQLGSKYYSSLPTQSNIQTGVFGVTIDGGGSAITAGEKTITAPMPYGGTIQSVTLLGYGTGTIAVDIWKGDYSTYAPTYVNSICSAGTCPAISSGNKYQDNTLTNWTTSFNQGDIFKFNVSGTPTATGCVVAVKTLKN